MSLVRAERWLQVRRLFEEAVEMPREERGAFLDAQCAVDDATREEVLALLAADTEATELPADRETGRSASAVDEPRFPEILGFSIIRRLGIGGSSRVYEATCLENGRRVAVKVVNSGAGAAALQRFRQESRVLSRLDHAGIVRLEETGHTRDGLVYLAMEFVDGHRIDQWCAEHRPSAAARIGLVLQMLDALSHAHAYGVVHRDIKPHNVIVDADARVRLVDFGVARLSGTDGQRTGFHTETCNIVGTFAYMSPEQADGQQGRIGPATDVYQCALVLFELLARRLPYEVEGRGAMALLKAILFERRLRLSEVVPALGGKLESALESALDADPSRRPQSARAFADLLRAAMADVVEA